MDDIKAWWLTLELLELGRHLDLLLSLLNELLVGRKQSHFAQETSVRWIHQRDWRDFQASNYDEVYFTSKEKISLNFVCMQFCYTTKNEWMNSVTAKKVPLEVIIIISRCFKSLHNPLKRNFTSMSIEKCWSEIGWLGFFSSCCRLLTF